MSSSAIGIFFVHVAVFQIGEVSVDEYSITRIENTYFVLLIFVAFDAIYLVRG